MNRIREIHKTDGADEEGARRATKEALVYVIEKMDGLTIAIEKKSSLRI